MITFKDVSKIYLPDHIALNNINLTIQPKEFVSLAGPSGAGKSTLLRLAIREEQPSKGQIFLEEQEINHLAAKDLPQLRRKIGIVFQDFKLLSNKTAYENIAFAMEVGGRTN